MKPTWLPSTDPFENAARVDDFPCSINRMRTGVKEPIVEMESPVQQLLKKEQTVHKQLGQHIQ